MTMIQVKRKDGSCFALQIVGEKPNLHERVAMLKKGLTEASASDLKACLAKAAKNSGEPEPVSAPVKVGG